MKRLYETCSITVVLVGSEDVVRTSTFAATADPNRDDPFDDFFTD